MGGQAFWFWFGSRYTSGWRSERHRLGSHYVSCRGVGSRSCATEQFGYVEQLPEETRQEVLRQITPESSPFSVEP